MKTSIESAKEITVVIITFDRYNFLRRLLKFYDQYNEKFNFLILDSSNQELDESLVRYIHRDNVQYHRYDSNIFFANKIAEGCQWIGTPYAVLCAEDDFLIPGGILRAKDYLEKHSDYASAHGLCFIHTRAEKITDLGFSIFPAYADGRSVEEESGLDRIATYLGGFSDYYPMYAVHRTELFQKIWLETKEYVSDWGLSELFPCAISFAHGKMKVLPVFYASREPNTYTWYSAQRHREMYTEEKVNKAVEGIAKHLRVTYNLSSDDAIEVVRCAFQEYLDRAFLKDKESKLKKWLKRIRSEIALRTRIRKIMGFKNRELISLEQEFFKDCVLVKSAVIDEGTLHEELNRTRQKYGNMNL